jgi:hypothetical protein
LALTSDQGTAGIDFQFEEVLATSPASGYVFPSNNFFGSGTNTFTTSTQILSVTDLDLNGVNVMPGLNDQIATVNILTSSNFSGTLQLSIDANNLILDGPQVTPTSVPEFLSIRDATLASPVINITAVPEANSLLFMSIVSSSLALRRRNRSNRARVQLRNIRK